MAARDFMNGKVAATSTLLDRIPVLDLHREKAKMSRLYLVPILSKAMDILELIESERRALTLEDILQQVPISKSSVYRILKTFVPLLGQRDCVWLKTAGELRGDACNVTLVGTASVPPNFNSSQSGSRRKRKQPERAIPSRASSG
jgi:hypothetical protein